MYYLQFSCIYNPTFFFWTKSYRVSHDSTFVFILTTWTSRMLLMRLDCNSLLSVVSQFDWCRLSSAWQSQWPIDQRAKTSFNRVTFNELHNMTGQLQKRSFTNDITAAILCKTHNDKAAMFVYQKKTWGNCSHMKTFFFPKKILKAAGHVSENDVFLFFVIGKKKKKSRATFLPNQKKTKLRKNRYHMITNDSYDRSLGFDKKVQRSHHYCFDSDVNRSRGFGLRPTQTPKYPAGRASGIQGIKMEKTLQRTERPLQRGS